jgi:hypothetical protein
MFFYLALIILCHVHLQQIISFYIEKTLNLLYPIKYLKIRFPNLSILATLYTDETWIVENIQ